MRKPKNYYSILGVSPETSLEEIKRSYRRLARRFHPDMKETSDAARFRDIQEAYEVLCSPEKRRAYDLTSSSEIPITYGSPSAPFAEAWFEPGPSAARPRWRRRSRVLDTDAEIVVTPEEARHGGTLSFEVRVGEICDACRGTGQGFMLWCWDCDGTGEVRRYRRVLFSIPPGVEHGATLSASVGPGQGELRARVLISQRR